MPAPAPKVAYVVTAYDAPANTPTRTIMAEKRCYGVQRAISWAATLAPVDSDLVATIRTTGRGTPRELIGSTRAGLFTPAIAYARHINRTNEGEPMTTTAKPESKPKTKPKQTAKPAAKTAETRKVTLVKRPSASAKLESKTGATVRLLDYKGSNTKAAQALPKGARYVGYCTTHGDLHVFDSEPSEKTLLDSAKWCTGCKASA